jgi:mono/diheme cytochrome c family protein
MLHCQGCHLADGSGSPGKVPALRGTVAQYLTIPEGREYVVRIPGVSQSPLDDAELAAVLNWVAGRFGPAAAAAAVAPYTADEVARARRPALTDVTSLRSALRRRLGLE